MPTCPGTADLRRRVRSSVEPGRPRNGGLANPGRIAAAMTWVLSDDVASVDGAMLSSDGGWSVV
jgi:hypothetical protein